MPEAAIASAEPHEGLVVGGRYRLERLLGEGGMGTVWAAEHVLTGQRFAVKLIRPDHARREQTRRRMLREAKVTGALNHPNLVRVHDAFVASSGSPVLVMELLSGRTLRQRLRAGPMSLDETARLLVPAMAALRSAHAAGVVHRDLKPDNLFLVALPGGGEDTRVLDFGLARVLAVDSASGLVTRTGEMVGTPSYMSPEQAFGETDLDERTDVWSMGVILYECVAGRRPFEGENFGQIVRRITRGERMPVREAAPALPADAADLIERMLTVSRDQRPRDLGDAIEVLSRHCPGVEARLIRPRRRWTPVVLGGCLAAAAGIAAAWLARPSADPAAPRPAAPVPVVAAAAVAPPPDAAVAAVAGAQTTTVAAPVEKPQTPQASQPPRRRAPRAEAARAPATAQPAETQKRPRIAREEDL